MKNCIVYLSTNSISSERIACGLIYIKDDGSHIFKWCQKKLDLYLSIMPNSEGIKNLIMVNFNGIENYQGSIEPVIVQSRKSNSGVIYYGEINPFVRLKNSDIESDFNFWFSRMINNEDPREINLNKLGI